MPDVASLERSHPNTRQTLSKILPNFNPVKPDQGSTVGQDPSATYNGGDNTRSNRSSDSRQDSSGGNNESKLVDPEDLQQSVETMNEMSEVLNREISFDILEDNTVQASISNVDSDEIIRQIPPHEVIEVQKKIDAFMGLFVDELR